jgi:type IV pilus assembly protein PilA
MQRAHRGFTLIELMIVIAILAILMAIAIPAYQDYTIRTRVSEGIVGAAWVKFAVAETYHSEGEVADQASTGVLAVEHGQYVDSITVADDGSGAITVTTTGTGAQPEVIVTFTPDLAVGQSIEWECTLDQGLPKHVPAECRN